NLDRHLVLTKKLTYKNREKILCLQRIRRLCVLKKLDKSLFQNRNKLRSQSPHVHGNIGFRINRSSIYRCAGFCLYDIACLHHIREETILVHLTDASGNTAVFTECILQNKSSHTEIKRLLRIILKKEIMD